MFDQIKSDLPNFPDQVVETWLLPLADTGYGWPPIQTALLRKSLDYWKKTKWNLGEFSFEFTEMDSGSQISINGLIEANFLGKLNAFSNIIDSQDRLKYMCKYILNHGTFPVPVIVKKKNGYLYTINGNPRIAALNYVRSCWANENDRKTLKAQSYKPPKPAHAAWIMEPPAEGEYEPDSIIAEEDERLKS